VGAVEIRGVAQRHRPATSPGHWRSLPALSTGYSKPLAGSPRLSDAEAKVGTQLGRAGGDLSGACRRRLDTRYRRPVGPDWLDGQPGGQPSRGAQKLPGREGRSADLGSSPSSQEMRLLAMNDRLRDVVAKKLGEDWSPQQISGWLSRQYSDDGAMRVSGETIYRTLFVQAKGVLKMELLAHLRSGRTMRRGRCASTSGQQRGQIKDAVSIRKRPPPEVEDRTVPGHWEGDLLAGARNTHVATLPGRTQLAVRDAGASERQRHRKRRGGPEQSDPTTAQDHDGYLDLEPGNGDGRSQEVHRRHRCRGLLLRPEESLAAWNE